MNRQETLKLDLEKAAQCAGMLANDIKDAFSTATGGADDKEYSVHDKALDVVLLDLIKKAVEIENVLKRLL